MKLNFIPARDGYHFVNSFVNHPWAARRSRPTGCAGAWSCPRWIVMPWFGPKDFHSWATDSEFNVVKQQIDWGRPAMLALWSMTPGDPIGHQGLCYRYNPLRLYIYDPNRPDREVELVPVSPQAGCEMRVGGTRYTTYLGYFWTDVYFWNEPP